MKEPKNNPEILNEEQDEDVVEIGEIITLTDDEGGDIDCEFLGVVEYQEKEYAIFHPVDEEEYSLALMEITEEETLVCVEDEDLFQKIIETYINEWFPEEEEDE